MPDWNTCVTIGSTGTWSREDTGGRAYEYDRAVKFGGILSTDLSIRRAYTKEARLSYDINLAGRRLCGNNDFPSKSGKVRERSRS